LRRLSARCPTAKLSSESSLSRSRRAGSSPSRRPTAGSVVGRAVVLFPLVVVFVVFVLGGLRGPFFPEESVKVLLFLDLEPHEPAGILRVFVEQLRLLEDVLVDLLHG